MKKFMHQYLETLKQNRKRIFWQLAITGGLYVTFEIIDRIYLRPKFEKEVQELIDQFDNTTE